jgi:hypothetical protein
MASYKKVLVFESEIQAQVLGGVLAERGIPHFIKSYDDLAYGGIFQSQKGWGHIEAHEEDHDEVRTIFDDLNKPED